MSRFRRVLVANSYNDSTLASSPATTAGEFSVIFVDGNEGLNAIAAAKTINEYPKALFCVGRGSDYPPYIVEVFGKGIISWKNAATSSGTQKVIKGGYSGSGTDQLAVNLYSNYEYGIRVMPVDSENESAKWEPTGKYYSTVSSANTPSASHGRYVLLKTLVDDINTDYFDGNLPVVCDLYHSESISALSANAVVVNGSTTVSCTNTGGAAPGDFLSLKGRIYKIVSEVSNTSWTIDRPYAGPSETITAGTTWASNAGYISSATVDENTYFGIWFTGDVDTDFTVSFEEGFDGGEGSGVVSTNLAYSIGLYDEVSTQESLSDPSFGIMSKVGVLPAERVKLATSGYTYDKWVITFNNYIEGNMSQTHNNEMELVIYLKSDVTTTNLAAYLQSWLSSSLGTGTFTAV